MGVLGEMRRWRDAFGTNRARWACRTYPMCYTLVIHLLYACYVVMSFGCDRCDLCDLCDLRRVLGDLCGGYVIW